MTTQEEHDALHPGMICQRCPVTLERQAYLREQVEKIRNHRPWWRRLAEIFGLSLPL